jgi:HAD superfamily hydrolase (TIGR01549 family)
LIKAVIFDLDGTLIQLQIDYEKLFQDFKNIMKISDTHPIADTVSKLDNETREKVFKVWDNAEHDALAKMVVKDEGIKIYTMFSQKPKALVTLQGRALAKAAIDQLGLSFDAIFTREDSLNRVEQLKNAAQKLRTGCKNVLFVGNTDEDSSAAKKVGCKFLRVK